MSNDSLSRCVALRQYQARSSIAINSGRSLAGTDMIVYEHRLLAQASPWLVPD